MNVIPVFKGHEPCECCAMPALWPLSGNEPERTCARIGCEVWRGWFQRGPGCRCGKLF